PDSWAHGRISTPKAFHHTAQGCRAAATLGKRFITQPRVAAWRLPWGRIITPKAFHHTAQGRRVAATLGKEATPEPLPRRGCIVSKRRGDETLSGFGILLLAAPTQGSRCAAT